MERKKIHLRGHRGTEEARRTTVEAYCVRTLTIRRRQDVRNTSIRPLVRLERDDGPSPVALNMET